MRVLIVDDSAVFRQGMRNLLATIADCEVTGVAGDGPSGIEAALEQQPDVVLMDVAMPGMSGIEATSRLLERAPHIGVVVMTMLAHEDAISQALRAGARGYVVKGAPAAEIVEALRAVHSGRAMLGAGVAHQLGNLIGRERDGNPFPELTAREREVLNLLAANATTVSIADVLGLATKTVRNHLSSIYTKLSVVDRTEAIVKARDAGMPHR